MLKLDLNHIEKIANELNLRSRQIVAVIELLDNGATVPFIARYRKEVTGSLDEVVITTIRDRIHQLRELDKRKEAILDSLKERNKLTDELKQKVLEAPTMSVLEDIYLPFRPKRRTRATVAKEKGLEPLAEIIFKQDNNVDLLKAAEDFVDKEKVKTIEEALAGARDIIAEWINEDARARAKIRELFMNKGVFRSKVIKGKEKEGSKYQDYFDWQESVNTVPSHRLLAVRRGEKESILMLKVIAPEEEAISILKDLFIKNDNACAQEVKLAMEDCYKRLLSLSMETEVRIATKEKADKEAIKNFSENLRQLLMAPPLGQKKVLAIDPGYRTGCKIVCLDAQGQLLENDTIFIAESEDKKQEAKAKIKNYYKKYNIEVIAIGNGTASRETENFIRSLNLEKLPIVVVNESGASIYSASDVAREEFPSLDVTVRGAISIGRRLMDPLAELVKIDPKSIGVGQYQHDVDQILLKQSLDDVVISCVNSVGVEVNTASKQLLMYVSGFGPKMAETVVKFREQQGPFRSRKEFKTISGFGSKVFEQAAGFLRINNADNPLDSSAVHPESYHCVDQMAKDIGCNVKELIQNTQLHKKIILEKYVSETIGLPTLRDILSELAKPGRDPRDQFELFSFKEGVEKIEDLKIGMKLPGIVTNITDFGAFVDIGVHNEGLLHVSELADKFVKHPSEVVKIHQKIKVTVVEIDLERKRIALSMKSKV